MSKNLEQMEPIVEKWQFVITFQFPQPPFPIPLHVVRQEVLDGKNGQVYSVSLKHRQDFSARFVHSSS